VNGEDRQRGRLDVKKWVVPRSSRASIQMIIFLGYPECISQAPWPLLIHDRQLRRRRPVCHLIICCDGAREDGPHRQQRRPAPELLVATTGGGIRQFRST
jgi:hypothetical protein